MSALARDMSSTSGSSTKFESSPMRFNGVVSVWVTGPNTLWRLPSLASNDCAVACQ